ncbi:MAG TPA: lysylphosphatidylglycerol synthase transmembrane domain-containing protein [Bacteroidales bacterium]|nr:lysylphosphatidylglycerol synthase transmembrane domain-containing protein [Bacteroidales bacterium]HPS27180.1 lysylphosphatidylglycerol synthase transmembrane domain-containing protein [Bacteroidales bacterium]
MKKKIFSILKILLFFGIGIFFIWLSVIKLGPEDKKQIFKSFSEANYWWLVLCFVLGLISHVLRTLRWAMLIDTVGYKPKFKNTFLSLMIGYFANLAIPRLGEITRCTMLAKYEKVPFQKSFGTVIAERGLDVVTFVVLFFINLLIQYKAIAGFVYDKIYFPLSEKFQFIGKGYFLYGAITLSVIFVLSLIVFNSRLMKFKLYSKIVNVIKGFWDGLKSLALVKKPFTFILYTLLIWVAYFTMTYVCFFSLASTSHTPIGAVASVFVMGTIAVMVSPGGIGAYPAFIEATLTLYGIPVFTSPNPVGLSLGWLIWGAQTVIIILAGVVSLILLPVLNNKNETPGKN